MKEYCYLNGHIIPLDEAKIGIGDIGLWRGYGLYDGLTAVGNKVFRFEDHWDRFISGARSLDISIPVNKEECQEVMEDLLKKCGYQRSIIRVVLTGGEVIDGVEYNPDKPTFSIVVKEWAPLAKEIYEKGAKLITHQFQREMPEVKTTNYIRAVNLQKLRKDKGAIEILFHHNGNVLEGSTSNIFLVKNNILITPSPGVLKGVTRKAVLEIASEKGLQVEERVVGKRELLDADEVFITSSFKDIVPIVEIDSSTINKGKVGKVTKDLMASFSMMLYLPIKRRAHRVSAGFG
jgi:branched-subunit amino acid aminotransferase/4-amino-4-deoxychorismate lyase